MPRILDDVSPSAASANSGPGSRTSIRSATCAAASATRGPDIRSAARARTSAASTRSVRGNHRTRVRSRNNSAPRARRAVAPQRAQLHVEQVGHRALVRWRAVSDKQRMVVGSASHRCALGARFRACRRAAPAAARSSPTSTASAPIAGQQIEFLGDSGCATCGLPLQATEQTTCGACLARPPRIARTRAAVAYDELSRSLAIRLKYGRKVAIARTMARYMAPLVERRRTIAAGAGAAASHAAVGPRVQSVGAGRARAVAAAGHRRPTRSLLKADPADPAAEGHEPAAAAQDRRRRVPCPRQASDCRQDRHPGRRRADDRKHRRSLCADAEARRRGASRAGQLGARGATCPVDALTTRA